MPLGLLSGMYNTVVNGYLQEQANQNNKQIAEANLALQREAYEYNKSLSEWQKNFSQSQFDYQKELNDLQMKREDSAIQRSVADYQAAGLNGLLAAGGSGSSAGSMTVGGNAQAGQQLSAPQNGYTKQAFKAEMQAMQLNSIFDIMNKKADTENKLMENYLIQEQIKTQIEETQNKRMDSLLKEYQGAKTEKEREYINEQIKALQKEIETAEHNLNLSQKWNVRSTDAVDTDFKELLGTINAEGNSTVATVLKVLMGIGKGILSK